MYEIVFYQNIKGESPVLDYMRTLNSSKSKDARIKLNKILEYVKALKTYGAQDLPSVYAKHLDGEIWELRPARNRILFAAVVGGRYVLLHYFLKTTQKTPLREIEAAKRELEDFKKRSGLYG